MSTKKDRVGFEHPVRRNVLTAPGIAEMYSNQVASSLGVLGGKSLLGNSVVAAFTAAGGTGVYKSQVSKSLRTLGMGSVLRDSVLSVLKGPDITGALGVRSVVGAASFMSAFGAAGTASVYKSQVSKSFRSLGVSSVLRDSVLSVLKGPDITGALGVRSVVGAASFMSAFGAAGTAGAYQSQVANSFRSLGPSSVLADTVLTGLRASSVLPLVGNQMVATTILDAAKVVDFRFATAVSRDWVARVDTLDPSATDIDEQFNAFAESLEADVPDTYNDGLGALAKNEELMEEVAEYWGLSWPPKTAAGRNALALLAAWTVLVALMVGVLGAPHIVLPLLTVGAITKDTWAATLKWSEDSSKKIRAMNKEDQSRES